MRNLITIIAIALSTMTFAQTQLDNVKGGSDNFNESGFGITASALGVAVSDGYEAIQANGLQISLEVDFAANSGFRFAPEVDLNVVTDGVDVVFGFIPGVQIGHDNIYALASYNTQLNVPYFGLGGLIPVGGSGGIQLQLQGSAVNVDGFAYGIGYGSIGYTFKF